MIQRSASVHGRRTWGIRRRLAGVWGVVLVAGLVGLVGPAGASATARVASGHAPAPVQPRSHPRPSAARPARGARATHATPAQLGSVPRLAPRSAIVHTFVVDTA